MTDPNTKSVNRRTALVHLVMLASSCVPALAQTSKKGPLHGLKAVTYKSPTCGCCSGYVDYLKTEGVKVEVRLRDDTALDQLKTKLGVPPEARSCHVTTMAGYIIEGHVPPEALLRLLQQKPRVTGIALPGMPIGVPGMPGPKTEPYRVVSFTGSKIQAFMTV